eukprot:3760443-Prymnesium_polylepis.1
MVLPAEDVTEQVAKAGESVFATGEVLAILAGLALAVPLSLRTGFADDVTDWDSSPAMSLAVHTCFMLATSMLLLSVVTAICGSLFALMCQSLEDLVQ